MHTVRLHTRADRDRAKRLIDAAPEGYTARLEAARRTVDQNALMWAMLSEISMARPEGRTHPPETWKALFMHALGYEQRFEMGLNGEPFPMGFRTSRLNVAQMSDLIECIREYAARHGVRLSDGDES